MDHAIYTAMGAASQTLNQQAVTASNLANASTPGFRAQLNALRAVPVEGLSLPTRTLVTASTPGADMTPGKMDYTSRPLDVALQQDGWLAVQTADGSEGYTRNGSIQVDPTGQLTIQGHPVIGEAGPIAVPEGAEITIAADGTISALNPGDPANTVAPVGRLKLVKATGSEVQPAITIPANALSITIGRDGVVSVTQQGQAAPVQVGQLNLTTFMNDTGLESIGENLYTETQSSGAPNESTPGLNGAGLLYQGYVETSNVNVAEELVNMIQVQRAYEINSKAVSTTDQMLQKLTQL
ncbi:flagellar basal body rod protein FlgF [Escherichia coli]|nr:flagellar basal body rod protein FlgF [Escherichia coli]EIZ0380582.1 flagellar basal body rod protein FlgF [Escherichia coli]